MFPPQISRLGCRLPPPARYYLRLNELPNGSGYVISKLSGPNGKEMASEECYRLTLPEAEKKLATIVNTKTTRKTGRNYQIISSSPQMSLW